VDFFSRFFSVCLVDSSVFYISAVEWAIIMIVVRNNNRVVKYQKRFITASVGCILTDLCTTHSH